MERYRIETDFEIIKEVPICEVKTATIEILRNFVEFCNQNGLRYYLAGGTLIGAVRHQGYVPWDDDMDVTMPRTDYEKFQILVSNGRLGKYVVRSMSTEPELHARPLTRLCDTSYMCQLNIDQAYLPAWLDILPWDGLPSDTFENEKHWKKIRALKYFSRLGRMPVSYMTKGKGIKREIKVFLKKILCFPFKLIGPVFFAKKIEKVAKTYDFDKCVYAGSVTCGYGPKERMPKSYFIDEDVGERFLWFEGILCRVPAHYEDILAHMYGNYLRLQAKKKQRKHVTASWKVKDKYNEDTDK